MGKQYILMHGLTEGRVDQDDIMESAIYYTLIVKGLRSWISRKGSPGKQNSNMFAVTT